MKIRKKKVCLSFLAVTLVAITVLISTAIADSTIKVPFKLDRNRVIIPTSVNGSTPLNLILDTGMRFDGVYLFRKELADLIDTTGAIEVRVPGAGSGEASTAIMIETGRLTFGDVTVDSQRVIISNAGHTQGFVTDGVIGWNLFGHYAVEIDYDQSIITLHDAAAFAADSSWYELPVTMIEGLPFFDCEIEINEGEVFTANVYIDLASGDALEMLVKPDQKFTMPDGLEDQYLGTGLSGDIHGQAGYGRRLKIGSWDLFDVATKFAPAEVRSKQDAGDAVLGNDAIRRFNIVFDYAHSRLFLKPNSSVDTPFE